MTGGSCAAQRGAPVRAPRAAVPEPLHWEGDLSGAVVARLEAELLDRLRVGTAPLVVSLAGATRLDPRAIALLLRAQLLAGAGQRAFSVVACPGPLRRVLAGAGALRQLAPALEPESAAPRRHRPRPAAAWST